MESGSKHLRSGLELVCAEMKGRATRAGVALWNLRNRYSEAIRKARIVENDRVAQKHYRKLNEAGKLPDP